MSSLYPMSRLHTLPRPCALALTVCLSACATTPGPRQTADAVLQLHEDSLRAHRERDWAWFGRDTADPTLIVSNGEILRPSAADQVARFRKYLTRAQFTRYEDLEAPVVRVSPDGRMAWVIARVIIEGTVPSDDGESIPLDSTWAWATLFEWRDDRWIRVANISNRMPDPGPRTRAPTPKGSNLSSTDGMDREARGLWVQTQAALGGALALDAVDRIEARADVSMSDAKGELTVRSHADGRLHFDQLQSSGHRLTVDVSPGPKGDTATRDGMIKVLSTRERNYLRGHEFHLIALAPALRYQDGQRRPDASFDGRSCHVIEFTDELGKPLRYFVDAQTKLPAGFVMVEPTSPDDAPITVVFSDWRRYGTLRLFTALNIQHRGETFAYQYTDIRLN